MTATQRAPGQDFSTENVDIVFVIEDTSNLHSHFNSFKFNYLAKFLEQPISNSINSGLFGDYPVQQYGLVLYNTNAPGTNDCISCFPPTHDLSVFQNQIKEIKFEGGGAETQAFVVEGMGVALEIFDDMEQSRINKKSKVKKLCIIVGQSSPYLNPCQFSQKYTGLTCERLAKLMVEREIKLTVLAPRRNDHLKKIFEAGCPEDNSLKDFGVDINHMILISGWILPVAEQSDVNNLTKATNSPPKKVRKVKPDGTPGNPTWNTGSPHPMQQQQQQPGPPLIDFNLNTPSPRDLGGVPGEHNQLHVPDLPVQYPDPSNQTHTRIPPPPHMQPGGIMQQQQQQHPMPGQVVVMQPGQMMPGQMMPPGHPAMMQRPMQPNQPGMMHQPMMQPGTMMQMSAAGPGPPQNISHDSFQTQQMQHQRQLQLQHQLHAQRQQAHAQQMQQPVQQQPVQQHQQPVPAPPQQNRRSVVWSGQLECWNASNRSSIIVQSTLALDESNTPQDIFNNISKWPEKAEITFIPGTIPQMLPTSKKATRLYFTLNPNNDKAQENSKAQIESALMTTEDCGLITVSHGGGSKEQAFMFYSSKLKIIMGIYPMTQAKFQEELSAKLQQAEFSAAVGSGPPQNNRPQQQQQQPKQIQQQPQQPGVLANMQPGTSNNNIAFQQMIAQQQIQQNQQRLIRAQGNPQMMGQAQPGQMNQRMQMQNQMNMQQMQQFHQMRNVQGIPGQMQQMAGGPMMGQMTQGQMIAQQGQMMQQGQMPQQGHMPQSQMLQQGGQPMQMRMGPGMQMSRNEEMMMQQQQQQMQMMMQRGPSGMTMQQQQQLQQNMQAQNMQAQNMQAQNMQAQSMQAQNMQAQSMQNNQMIRQQQPWTGRQ